MHAPRDRKQWHFTWVFSLNLYRTKEAAGNLQGEPSRIPLPLNVQSTPCMIGRAAKGTAAPKQARSQCDDRACVSRRTHLPYPASKVLPSRLPLPDVCWLDTSQRRCYSTVRTIPSHYQRAAESLVHIANISIHHLVSYSVTVLFLGKISYKERWRQYLEAMQHSQEFERLLQLQTARQEAMMRFVYK